ncbi:MAG: Uma2 family endonuclease [Bryobacterales bacterium]|nr:Uma2 family endonuclease [Bryobacterales bacterium]MDE0260822.1 Uma2 family endonuclease [Bryobacterales bacterium]MDE0621610.1 Uma2 family endonuclease [Bryobacterales bacterium]
MASTTTTATHRPAAVEYPYSDGKIMAEVPRHVDAIFYAMATLRNWFARHDRVQVGANMFLYYQEGDNTKRVTPDLFVAKGLKALPEQSYKLWEEGRPPTWILEVASPSTEDRDRGEKQALYASIGVKEYWRFHPTGSLKGAQRPKTRLEGGVLGGLGYELLESHRDGSIRSEVLGLDVRVDDRAGKHHLLRFRDPETGLDLLTFEELEDDRQSAEKNRRLAEEKRRSAEEKLLEESAARRAAEQAHRAEIRARRDAEAETARLRAYIARLEGGRGGGPGSDS